jgi:hypothetical protein
MIVVVESWNEKLTNSAAVSIRILKELPWVPLGLLLVPQDGSQGALTGPLTGPSPGVDPPPLLLLYYFYIASSTSLSLIIQCVIDYLCMVAGARSF